MSYQAMKWALRSAPTVNAVESLVLTCYASYADESGEGLWPPVRVIMRDSKLARPTVRKYRKALEARGLLVPDGNGRFTISMSKKESK